jgi:hypothetical protein
MRKTMAKNIVFKRNNMSHLKDKCGLRTPLFWVIRQRVVVITDVSGQPVGPILKGDLDS